MNHIIGNGVLLSYMETEIICPVCEGVFDCAEKSGKAKYPIFKMKCPLCKAKLEISMPIFGGQTKCREVINSKFVHALETESISKVNGIEIKHGGL